MGQKINPIGFRTAVTSDWQSLWYSDKNYSKFLLEDKKIRDFLRSRSAEAGIREIRIERSTNTKITLSVARPGVIIGRGGAGLSELRELISREIGGKVDISVEEVRRPELSAQLVAEEIVRAISRRMPVKRIMNQTCEKVIGRGAKGVKIIVAGVIGGPSSIHRSERIVRGSVPAQTIRANIDFSRLTAFTSYGTLGIKVWIYLGEKEIQR